MDDEYEADLSRLTHELEDAHAQEADRKTAEIMEKLDLQKFNDAIHAVRGILSKKIKEMENKP